ncbi:flagellar basal body-associated FliL family protein [Rhodovulum adriaticum]|uniref:Flagellar protein FliL n=1 Tax=Rhodovulum adriaticum TaxID=35804 RepID=A0A4V2SMK2_RHOAD|nr:flagellar basal body-associated FliL family protein [Rhodovulum adriaticum]MBK1634779.1 flagellar basal body protein FliL [Rhodovulum adriaticum]TCP27646.1 flagellar FliL protein [Rhodovulum adriaticum]
MAETETENADNPPQKSRKPLILGAVLAVLLGVAGFFAAYSGLIPGGRGGNAGDPAADFQNTAFLPLDPLVVSLGAGADSRHLRFSAQLELDAAHAAEVAHIKPRVLDVLNSYLRAIDLAELDDPGSLVKLRAQMLRRVQMVSGPGRVHDLLVTEFVFN